MEMSWLSLLPPIIVIITAFITKNLNKSLLFGIISAAFIAAQFSIIGTITLIMDRFWEQLIDIEKIYLYIFLLAIASLVALYNHSGCVTSFAHLITQRVRNPLTIQTSSLLLSFTLFVDDYLSILTTGFVMSPLTDRFRIPRQKLAFLVHSLAGSVVILVPVSSWVATITVYLNQSGIDLTPAPNVQVLADPFYIYLKTLPFMFYSFLIIASVFFIVRKNISFGPMREYEIMAQKQPQPKMIKTDRSIAGSIADLFIPLCVLIGSMFIGILYTGNYYLFGGNNSFIEAVKSTDQIFLIMCISGVLALAIGLILSLARKTLTIPHIPHIFGSGIKLMYSAIIMVFLASTLGIMLKDDMFTGNYLAHILLGAIPISLLPVMFFIASLITTIATGGAWATFALMLAIAIPMLSSLLPITIPASPEAMPILFPILGAIFSGAVCGDHISPVSETTVMTSTSTGTLPFEHAYTQIFYALPAVGCTMLAFTLSGYLIDYATWVNLLISLGISMCLCFGILTALNKNRQ